MEIEDWFGGVWVDPACWYYANSDCEHQNILIRSSFMKADPLNSYEPLHYPDNEVVRAENGLPVKLYNALGTFLTETEIATDPDYDGLEAIELHKPMFDKFGYFRVERHGYDEVYGERESNRTYWATRFNIVDGDGNPKPIIYYYSAGFPDELKAASQEMAVAYNAVFRQAASARLGKKVSEKMFEIRENSGQRIGDMRYSFLHYVHKPTMAGLLGYGPSNADPLSGELISASAYIYGAEAKLWAGTGRQVVDLINGRITPEDLSLGNDVKYMLKKMADGAGKPGAGPKTPSLAELHKFIEDTLHTPRAAAIKKAGFQNKKLKKGSHWFQAQLARIKGTIFEDLLINDEVKLLQGQGVIGPGDAIPAKLKHAISPVNWVAKSKRDQFRKRQKLMMKRNMYMAQFADDAIMGLALANKDTDPDALQKLLETAIFKSTAEHELGHTFGLRHNFEGSYDALNFPREFWDQMDADASFPPKPRTQAQIEGRMDEYRYSSIMDYPARFNADIQGLGAYDRAAIMFGYAGMVEVFKNAPPEPLIDWESYDFGTARALQQIRHYSSLPTALGGVDAMFDREFIPYSTFMSQYTGATPERAYYEVPYRFCSDEYESATVSCSTYDAGMDPYEIVQDAATRYDNYYFFDAFKRDRAGWEGWYYYWRLYDRYFRFMHIGYQHWAFSNYWDSQYWEDQRGAWELADGSVVEVVEDIEWAKAVDGGLPSTAATRTGLNFLVKVLATPEPGAYIYDPDLNLYWNWTSDPNVWPLCQGVSEKDDPSQDCVDLNVQAGEGRYSFTQYDVDGGYYFYERPQRVGAFSDKVLALEMLTDPSVNFLGVNTGEDIQAYALGYWLYFPDVLSKVFGGIIADQVKQFAGTTAKGKYFPPDVFTPAPGGNTVVDPDTWSTVQYYAMWLGMSGFSMGFDNTFNDLIKIWVDGDGEGQKVFDPNDPSVASYVNPVSQRTYRAVQHPDTKKFFSVGYEMVKRAGSLQYRIDNPEEFNDDENATAYTRVLLSYQVELMDLTRGMHELYGKLYF
jgi:hypothetical protein